MLSPTEAAALVRGQDLKRYVRAAAAIRGIYEDRHLAREVSVSERTVSGWWRGARVRESFTPSPAYGDLETLRPVGPIVGTRSDSSVSNRD